MEDKGLELTKEEFTEIYLKPIIKLAIEEYLKEFPDGKD